MLIFFGFNVTTPAGAKKCVNFMSGDLERLEGLFPDNPVWQSRENNVRQITLAQAKALYDVMTTFYVKNDVSSEPYVANQIGPAVTSDLQSVFDDLIQFFETELGFAAPEAVRKAIVMRQEGRRQRDEQSAKDYFTAVSELFEKMGTLRAPTNDLRVALGKKLTEYRHRLENDRRWGFKHPQFALLTEPGYRDTLYKIAVSGAVLKQAGGEVRIGSIAKQMIEKYDRAFNAEEFLNACLVIGKYVGMELDAECRMVPSGNAVTV